MRILVSNEVNEYETNLEYLFRIYECNDIDILKCRCPLNLEFIDLQAMATDKFRDMVLEVEEQEYEIIAKIIEDRIIK